VVSDNDFIRAKTLKALKTYKVLLFRGYTGLTQNNVRAFKLDNQIKDKDKI